jgi:fructokinase
VITVVGEALIDLVLEPQGTLTSALGGAPFNTARTCGRLGADVSFVGSISVDRFGTRLFDQLAADRVRTDNVRRCQEPTTLAVAELDDRGTARYRFYIEGTSAPALGEVLDVSQGMLFVGGLGLVLQPMATTVEAIVAGASGGAAIMVDVNARPEIVTDRQQFVSRVERVLRSADVVKVSDEDLAYLDPGQPPVDAARRLLGAGPKAVLMTAGGDGVMVITRNGEQRVAVEPVDVVDTIGAGDAFSGGFMTWWTEAALGAADLSSIDHVAAAAEAACTVAGVVCSRRGADPPWRHELPDSWSAHAERRR